ncbi:MAG: hypothetical protein AAGD05_16105, partial [Bacteroidota bacterium]
MEELIQKMEDDIGLVIVIIFAFSIGLAIVEFCYELYKKKINKWRLGEMWASFTVFIVAQLMEKISVVIFTAGFYFLSKYIPWQIPINIWTTLLCILFIDFLYYWEHRIAHQVRLFWTQHAV